MHGSVRYTKLPTEGRDDIGNEGANEDSDEEVTAYIQQSAEKRPEVVGKRVTCFRVMAAVVLLCTALMFVLFEWYGWWPNLDNAGTHITIPEEHEEHHHHHTGDDDDDNDPKDGNDHHHSHEHTSLYHHAVVVSSSENCSRVGRRLLQEGGNVVDAAIASLLCLGVVHPHTAGIGGMFSAILYNSTSGSTKAIRSTSPQVALTTYGVPSVLHGIKDLHSRWGRAEWSQLFKEAITLAKDGFLIDSLLVRALESHKDEILQSDLCNLFCDTSGSMKSEGALVKNRNLSELLLSASLNKSHFLDTLAVKLSEDLSLHERPGFLAAIQHSRGEISDPLIVERDKYTVLSAALPFADPMLSDILQQVRQRSLSFQNVTDFNNSAASYTALLNLIQELNDTSMAVNNTNTSDISALYLQSSHIGVLDRQGNFVIMCISLNSTWGSGRFLPSSGIILNSFSANVSDLPYLSFPLVLKITDDDSDGDNEVEVVAFSGGRSALFNAAFFLHNRIDIGLSSKEAVAFPLLHMEHGNSSTVCLSTISNGSDSYMMFSERQSALHKVEDCPDHSQSMLLQLHADHVGAYGTPVANCHANGY